MKLGFCHLGFRVYSARRVWYVAKRPSEAAVEGDQGPLEREAAVPPTEWGGHGQGGRPPHCAPPAGSCVRAGRRPSSPPGRCYALLPEAAGIPMASPPPGQAWAAPLTKPPAFWSCVPESHLHPECVRKMARPRNCPCRHTWGISMGRLISRGTDVAHPLPNKGWPRGFGFALF